MAIIMLISSTLRCGFNISFRGTSLDSCKLFPSGGWESNHQVLQRPQYLCETERETDREMHCIITKFKCMPKPFMHLSSYTKTRSCLCALDLSSPRAQQVPADSTVRRWPRLTLLFTLPKSGYHLVTCLRSGKGIPQKRLEKVLKKYCYMWHFYNF